MRGKLVVGALVAAGLLGIIWWQSGVDTFLAMLALGLVSAVIGYVAYRRRNSTAGDKGAEPKDR